MGSCKSGSVTYLFPSGATSATIAKTMASATVSPPPMSKGRDDSQTVRKSQRVWFQAAAIQISCDKIMPKIQSPRTGLRPRRSASVP